MSSRQEFAPVAWVELLRWRREGRIPDDACIIDHPTGDTLPVPACYARRHIQRTMPSR
jgi:hypothetical protein